MTTTEKPWTARKIAAIAPLLHNVTCHNGDYCARAIIAADPLEPIAAALYEALENITSRFHRALIATGSHPEYADAACAKARAAIALANGEVG